MIKDESFSKNHLVSFKKQKLFSKMDPGNLERMIYALHLLELLRNENLDFIFKGGTSLILLLEDPRRFSVDIDILTADDRTVIEDTLTRIVRNTKFIRFEIDEKRSYVAGGIPKAHYLIYFNSDIQKRESFVFLDVLFGENFFPQTEECKIQSTFFDSVSPVNSVRVPTVNSIFGDKMTAFAPETTGYHYKKGLELQMVKQLFDLSALFDRLSDYSEVISAVNAKIDTLNSYPHYSWQRDQIFEDIFQTCYLIATAGRFLKHDEKFKYEEIKRGVESFSNFLIHGTFLITDAVEAAGKLALIVEKVKQKNIEPLLEYDVNRGNDAYPITGEDYNALNKLRRQPSKAIYYWYQTIELRRGARRG